MAEGNRNFVDQIYVTDGESSNNGQIIDIGAKAENVYFNDNVTLPNKLAEIANNSALTSKSQINITTDKVTSIVLNDSSDYNIVNLICDKKDNNNQVAFYRKNLFDFSVCDININDLATVNSVNRDNCTINFTTNETGINSGIYFRHIDLNSVNKGYGIDYTKLNSKPVTLSFDAQSDIDCILRVQFTKTSYTSVNISSTKQRFYVTEVVDMSKLNKAICFYLDSVEATVTISNIQIEVNNTATDYEDCDYQKVTLTDANINSLHTYYPSTTVISDSDFVLTYIADSKNYIDNNLDTKENASNKIDTINFPSTTYYPSSKAVWDYVTSKNSTLINGIENLKNNKVNITDFNIFKDTTNQAIESLKSNKLDKTDFNTYKTATDKAIADNTKSIKANKTSVDNLSKDFNTYKTAIANLEAYIGIITDVAGLCVDYENKTFTRLAGAVGLSAGPDFDKWKMYGGRKRCNVADDGTILAYYGDANYKEDGSNGQVMVYQPKFYYLVAPINYDVQETGVGYHLRKANYYVSEKARTGFRLHPAFYDVNGNEVDYILMGAYEACLYDTSASEYITDDAQVMTVGEDKLSSIAGVKPVSGSTQNLTRPNVETLAQNRGSNWHGSTVKIASMNQLLCMIEMGTMNFQSAIGQGVVSYASGSGNEASNTGATSSLGNGTGQATQTTHISSDGTETIDTTSGKLSVSYRGLENPWGNIWEFEYGVNIWGNGNMAGGEPYVADDFNFAESKRTDNYEGAGFTVTNANDYISAMGYSTRCDWLFMASECAGNSSLPVGDYTYVTPNLNRYGIARLGGSYCNGANAGGFYWNLDSSVGSHYRFIGGRLLYVPTATA